MNDLGLISYGVGSIAFVALFIVLAIGYRNHHTGGLLLVATAVNAGWLVISAYAYYDNNFSPLWVYILEALRNGAWYAFLLQVLDFNLKVQGLVRRLALLALVLVLLQA